MAAISKAYTSKTGEKSIGSDNEWTVDYAERVGNITGAQDEPMGVDKATSSISQSRHSVAPLGPRLCGWRLTPETRAVLRAEAAERTRARRVFFAACRRGVLVRPALCERCGKGPRHSRGIQAHHTNYRKPLQVSWLCAWCHLWANHKTKMVYLAAYGRVGIGLQDWRL
jgi:hypothetical protein